ncbi:helix-turn-helix transcriptional regulator [Staphylococcus nepalensis]|uniref:Helix-turn-helix transcriptional regulator n=1 Tax=Staphylococcus nepalensis TaxID=214473 RepID=A0ABS3L340_9STAP|nr:helix-turn-helix transcriptional regulator [Staphylococcus nepalensis]MBO1213037.1 helix-turn-helix transcriptional regulator [Staphylococcus nepalensis]MBO1217140.1 helix-turn-helix transcriptional regulator [Staphylococcus nepalensis]MBO1227957.1 helix-turn-helix transcriptional regulator [Staphylococcus nepalensis]MBO1235794.1 helix-turn-helix transcriptional regulator [Staphylococcus nepalensis]MBO1238354.1 helix-turn-helix transcriptional regulator [Staphylococcus nepalensis]
MSIYIKNHHLKKVMFLKGYNLSQLAIETDVSLSYMSLIMNGKRNPSAKLAKKISSVLDVEIEELFEFEQKEA